MHIQHMSASILAASLVVASETNDVLTQSTLSTFSTIFHNLRTTFGALATSLAKRTDDLSNRDTLILAFWSHNTSTLTYTVVLVECDGRCSPFPGSDGRYSDADSILYMGGYTVCEAFPNERCISSGIFTPRFTDWWMLRYPGKAWRSFKRWSPSEVKPDDRGLKMPPK